MCGPAVVLPAAQLTTLTPPAAITGFATETTLGTIDADTGNIATDTSTIAGDTTSLDGKTPALGTAAMAASSPVTIASDDTLVTAIKTSVETLDNAIAGSEMQVDVVAELPTGTNSIGQVTANAGTNLNTALLALEAGGNLATLVTDSALVKKSLGTAVAPTIDSYTSAVVDCAAGATTAVIATPGANKQLWIYGLYGRADTAAGLVTLKDSSATALTGDLAVSDEGAIDIAPSGNFAMPRFKLASDKGFSITTVGCSFDGVVSYAIVSV